MEFILSSLSSSRRDNPFCAILTYCSEIADLLEISYREEDKKVVINALWINQTIKDVDFFPTFLVGKIKSVESMSSEGVVHSISALDSIRDEVSSLNLPGGLVPLYQLKRRFPQRYPKLLADLALYLRSKMQSDEFTSVGGSLSLDDLEYFLQDFPDKDLLEDLELADKEALVQLCIDDEMGQMLDVWGKVPLPQAMSNINNPAEVMEQLRLTIDGMGEKEFKNFTRVKGVTLSETEDSIRIKGGVKLSESGSMVTVKGRSDFEGADIVRIKGQGQVSGEENIRVHGHDKNIINEDVVRVVGNKANLKDLNIRIKGNKSLEKQGLHFKVKDGISSDLKDIDVPLGSDFLRKLKDGSDLGDIELPDDFVLLNSNGEEIAFKIEEMELPSFEDIFPDLDFPDIELQNFNQVDQLEDLLAKYPFPEGSEEKLKNFLEQKQSAMEKRSDLAQLMIAQDENSEIDDLAKMFNEDNLSDTLFDMIVIEEPMQVTLADGTIAEITQDDLDFPDFPIDVELPEGAFDSFDSIPGFDDLPEDFVAGFSEKQK